MRKFQISGRLIVTILLTLFMDGAISGNAMAAGALDSCSLLTREEVAGIMGSPVTKATLAQEPRPNCRYSLEKSAVIVFLFNGEGARAGFENGKKYQDKSIKPVTGIGDDAYWAENAKILNILKKRTYVTINAPGVKTFTRETASALGKKAVSRLP